MIGATIRREALVRVRRKHPEDLSMVTDSAAVIGFRNVPAHTYDHVEEAAVWAIVTEKIPRFISELEQTEGISG